VGNPKTLRDYLQRRAEREQLGPLVNRPMTGPARAYVRTYARFVGGRSTLEALRSDHVPPELARELRRLVLEARGTKGATRPGGAS
jgi:hypothetical protein